MIRRWKVGWVVYAAAMLGASTCGRTGMGQPVVLESAQLGATGRIGGASITVSQFIGWRFEISEPLIVQRVGGHMLSIPDEPGDIFAALVKLPAIDAMPLGTPFTTEEVVATTTFRPPFPSDEVRTPLSATLDPGAYALVFGTGMFGATGAGGFHNGPDQPDIAPTTISSYIFWGLAFPGQPFMWRTNLASNMRFVVEGVPRIDGDYNVDGVVNDDDYNLWRADFDSSTNLAADGNGNGSVDAADFVVWRNNLTTSSSGGTLVSGGAEVPEPAAFALLVAAAALLVGHRFGRR